MARRETATVETLTASVKTLMVGARQVTLTIFRQLDVVEITEIIPFGRVNPKGHDTDWITVAGKRKITGELVRASAPATWEAILQHTGMASDARALAEETRRNAMMNKRERGEHLQAIADSAGIDARHAAYIRELEDGIRKITAPYVALADELSALPLIVLAGLS